jgi:hypothetical protein
MSRKTPPQTYVIFTLAADNINNSVLDIVPVPSRDIDALTIPADANRFYFFDAPANITDTYDAYQAAQNKSPEYIIAAKVLSRDEAAPIIRRYEKYRHSAVFELLWEETLLNNDFFAHTRNGELIPLEDKNVTVIDADKNQLYPAPPPKDQGVALDRKVTVMRPIRIRKNDPS